MSVNSVFGQNLRQLALSRGSLTAVAAELGISRVQFQRYLKGESFPKPNLLQRICGHFGVDARILLEPVDKITPLPEAHSSRWMNGAGPGQAEAEALDEDLQRLFGWSLRGHTHRLTREALPDGIYRCWVGESSKPDTFYCMAVQIGHGAGRGRGAARGSGRAGDVVPDEARSTRSYFDRAQFTGLPNAEMKRRREVRGVMLGVPDGMIWLAFNPAPIYRITLAHFAPNPVIADGSFVGYIARGRAELPGFSRAARAFLEPVPRRIRDVLARCRTKPVYSAREVPEAVLDHIRDPVEWRGQPFSL